MGKLEKYEKVNKCKTLEELADVILSFADKDGNIKGRTKKFSAEKMAIDCRNYRKLFSYGHHNSLTRKFGIRQQAMYILFYM